MSIWLLHAMTMREQHPHCMDRKPTHQSLACDRFCFPFHNLKPFLIHCHEDLKLSYRLEEFCNLHCNRQMWLYFYFAKLFHTPNILQMFKYTLELGCRKVKSLYNPPQHWNRDSSLPTACSQPCQTNSDPTATLHFIRSHLYLKRHGKMT